MTNDTNNLPADDEDTRGHAAIRKFVEPAGEDDTIDTEGHGVRVRFVEPAGEDDTIDTQGHEFIQVGEPVADSETAAAEPADDGDDPEDTGGHRFYNVGVDFD